MRTLFACIVAFLVTSLPIEVSAAGKPAANPPAEASAADAPATEEARTLYALGLAVGRNLRSAFALTPEEYATVKAGITAAVLGKPPAVDISVYGPKIQPLQTARAHAIAEREHAVAEREEATGAAYIEHAAQKQGVVRTPSGALIETLTAGSGGSPTAKDKVKVQYEGKLIDGTVFDSSHGQPATFALSGVIPCWTETVQTMKVGGKSRIVCPAKLAYGDRGSGPTIRPGATLVFEIELLEIVH